MKPKSEPVGASLSTTLGNCICGHGYASTCPVHGESLQPDRGELMPLEQISGCIKDFTGGLPLREYLDEINEEDGFPRIAADELDAANIEGNKRGVQTSTLATSDPQLGASLSAQTPPDGGSDKVKSCLRFIRQCVSGSCNELDLEVIRGEIDGALGEADGNSESLRRALKSLYNEVHGALGIAEPEIRAAIGNTNMACIERRLSEAKSALGGAAQEGDCPCGATVVRKSDSANKSKLCADCAAQEEAPSPWKSMSESPKSVGDYLVALKTPRADSLNFFIVSLASYLGDAGWSKAAEGANLWMEIPEPRERTVMPIETTGRTTATTTIDKTGDASVKTRGVVVEEEAPSPAQCPTCYSTDRKVRACRWCGGRHKVLREGEICDNDSWHDGGVVAEEEAGAPTKPKCGNCGGSTEQAEDRHWYCTNPDCANRKPVVAEAEPLCLHNYKARHLDRAGNLRCECGKIIPESAKGL